jgi:hypothetical protein
MSEDGLTGRHESLRAAAVEVLEAAPRGEAELAAALERLRDALRGEAPASPPEPGRPVLDPFEHYLTRLRYERDQPPAAITLERMAVELRHRLDNDRSLDDRLPGDPDRNVTVTELRAMVVGALLKELAARLSPGPAFGPGRSGQPLAGVAEALAKELLDQTFVGMQ